MASATKPMNAASSARRASSTSTNGDAPNTRPTRMPDRARQVRNRWIHGRRGEVDEGGRPARRGIAEVRPRASRVVAPEDSVEEQRAQTTLEARRHVGTEITLGDRFGRGGPTPRPRARWKCATAQEVHAFVEAGEWRQGDGKRQPEHARNRDEREMGPRYHGTRASGSGASSAISTGSTWVVSTAAGVSAVTSSSMVGFASGRRLRHVSRRDSSAYTTGFATVGISAGSGVDSCSGVSKRPEGTLRHEAAWLVRGRWPTA